jgi:hypothetical protein
VTGVQTCALPISSYVFTAFELQNEAGGVIRAWEGLGLGKGETWTGDVDQEGLYTLYCAVRDNAEEAEELYEYGEVEIKLHQVTGLGIAGETCITASDRDGDGFSDTWETRNGFNPEDPADGGPVYVSTTGKDTNPGTATLPYFTLAKGVEKAKSGLTEEARTVVVTGTLNRGTESAAGSDTAVFSIIDTGLHGVTIVGGDPLPTLDATGTNGSMKRVLYLGPGTKLTLENITIQNGLAYRGAGIHADGAELTLGTGVVIQKCSTTGGSSSGTGVYASGGAVVVMKGGSLIGDDDLNDKINNANAGWMGVGVALLDGSSLTMENGSRITGNSFLGGGAVSADLGSQITLEPGAEIIGNKSSQDSTLTSNHGGGVRLTRGSKLIMKGGLISGNVITKGNGGGGVYVGSESVFEMQGGTIRGNSVGKAAADGKSAVMGNGSGVYVDVGGIFRMTGGDIASNTATGLGGGVYVNGGSFFKTGGAVYGSDGPAPNTAGGETGKGHAFFGTPANPADKTLQDSFTF